MAPTVYQVSMSALSLGLGTEFSLINVVVGQLATRIILYLDNLILTSFAVPHSRLQVQSANLPRLGVQPIVHQFKSDVCPAANDVFESCRFRYAGHAAFECLDRTCTA
ncbi:hypothetical protein PMIN03_012488 [Paraphaeosphaeria minitans]